MNEQSKPQGTPRSLARSVLATIPTVLVLGSLAAIGYWGYRTGWKAPQFSKLFPSAQQAEKEDWCELHNVPDSRCIACQPELAGEDVADWCQEHGVPESRCTACHPEILATGVAGDWCPEHGLPESGCTLCHPEIARRGELPSDPNAVVISSAASDGERSGGGSADASGLFSIRDARTCQTHALKVQFASSAAVEKSGVRFGQVVERPMSDSVLANAQVEYDRARFAKLAPRANGTAWRVERDLGERVHAGDVLALIESAEVGRAKSDLLLAQAAVEAAVNEVARVRTSSDAGFRTVTERVAAENNAQKAEIALFSARQALANLGLTPPSGSVDATQIATLGLSKEFIKSLAAGTASANLIPMKAPFDGVIVMRDVVTGEVVDSTRTLFEIADTSRMWITADVSQADARRVAVGEEVIFLPENARDEAVFGLVTWVDTSVDERTRTVKVRADVDNTDGALRAHSFGRAQIVVRTSANAIAVPNAAIQWEGCCYVVFVQLTEDIFQTRKVRLGAKDSAYTEVLGGVLPGEIVATTGSHVLKSEILKSRFGAGCCAE